jgi:hypothetical protein
MGLDLGILVGETKMKKTGQFFVYTNFLKWSLHSNYERHFSPDGTNKKVSISQAD